MLSVVEVCADYGGVNVFHVCLNFGGVYGVGFCVNGCGVVCVVVWCWLLTSGCCLLCCFVWPCGVVVFSLFIAAWTYVVVSVRLVVCSLSVFPCLCMLMFVQLHLIGSQTITG